MALPPFLDFFGAKTSTAEVPKKAAAASNGRIKSLLRRINSKGAASMAAFYVMCTDGSREIVSCLRGDYSGAGRAGLTWRSVPRPQLDAAGNVGEVEPDFYAAEVRALGADGCGDAGSKVARGTDIASKLRVDFAELGDFVEGGAVDFFLGVEAGANGPFVEEMEEGAAFDEANGFGVGEKDESVFDGDAAVEEFVLGGPGFAHGAVVEVAGARIVF